MSKKIKVASLVVGASVLAAPHAMATEGYFQYGLGARHAAMGGAGVAFVRDASGMILNPAGLATLEGSELDLALTIFSPRRKYTGSGEPGFTPSGEVESGSNYFPIPNVAYSRSIDETSGWGIAMYGNGGMNTDYPAVAGGMFCPAEGSGLFCGGEAGVDLMQAFLSVSYSKKVGGVSFGISPLLVGQRFQAKGLSFFGGFSSDAANLTDNGHDLSVGVGIKFGASADLTDYFHIGATVQPKINMSKFKDYAGLFADGGDFDIPTTFTVGMALDATEDLTVMLDYNRIYYSKVGAIGNDVPNMMELMSGGPGLGAAGGPGFGWEDISTIKIGVEWKQSDNLKLRAGFSRNQNPVGPEDITLNVLAPGIVRSHITGGFEYGLSNGSAFEFAAAFVPTESVEGAGMMNPNHIVKAEMKQYAVSFGWKKKF